MSVDRPTRVAALGLHHETNTFSSFATTYESFSTSSYGGLLRGAQIEEHQRSSHSTFAGYTRPPTNSASTSCRCSSRSTHLLRERGPWDGVLLNQMGAAVSEDFPDVDGEVAARTRAVVGPDVPVVMTLDLHANLSQKMAEHTQAIVVYRTNPHMDASERAIDACEILVRTIKGEIRPVSALEMPPMVISILRQDTREEPMRGVMADVEVANRRPGIIHTSMGQGYPGQTLRRWVLRSTRWPVAIYRRRARPRAGWRSGPGRVALSLPPRRHSRRARRSSTPRAHHAGRSCSWTSATTWAPAALVTRRSSWPKRSGLVREACCRRCAIPRPSKLVWRPALVRWSRCRLAGKPMHCTARPSPCRATFA